MANRRNSDLNRFLDSGLDVEPHPDREYHFRTGWLSATFICRQHSLDATSPGDLLFKLRAQKDVAELSRTLARRFVDREAIRLGKQLKRPYFYLDAHHYRMRFFRGRHHAVFTVLHGVEEFLNRNRRTRIDDLRHLIQLHLEGSIRWAQSANLDETVHTICPPWRWFRVTNGSAVTQ